MEPVYTYDPRTRPQTAHAEIINCRKLAVETSLWKPVSETVVWKHNEKSAVQRLLQNLAVRLASGALLR